MPNLNFGPKFRYNKKQLNNLDNQIKKVANLFNVAFNNSDENVRNMFEDFDDLIKILDEFKDR